MSQQYIPAGRTSMAAYRDKQYQLQTEYARSPHPRITTSISLSGRIIHKVEKALNIEISSIEQMHRVEDFIKSQHREITKIIKEQGIPSRPEDTPQKMAGNLRSDRIKQLPEVERVYLVTPDGKIVGEKTVRGDFRKQFKHVLKELPEMLNVFTSLPGAFEQREIGIYEIEPQRILLASTGIEFYLILIKPQTKYNELAQKISAILKAE